MQQNAPKSIFIISFRWNISHNTHRKGYAMKFSQRKKHVPDLKFCVLFYRIYMKGGGLILHVCQYVFQNHLKSRKIYMYTCRLRRYNYTHDQLNTRH